MYVVTKYFVVWYDRNKSITVAMQEFDTWDEALEVHLKALRAETAAGPTVSLLGAESRADCIKYFGAFFHPGGIVA